MQFPNRKAEKTQMGWHAIQSISHSIWISALLKELEHSFFKNSQQYKL